MTFWIAFGIGLLIGAAVMVVALGLCQISARAELEGEIAELQHKLNTMKQRLIWSK